MKEDKIPDSYYFFSKHNLKLDQMQESNTRNILEVTKDIKRKELVRDKTYTRKTVAFHPFMNVLETCLVSDNIYPIDTLKEDGLGSYGLDGRNKRETIEKLEGRGFDAPCLEKCLKGGSRTACMVKYKTLFSYNAGFFGA